MPNNFAFIDSQNVNLAIRDQGWRLDWKRFRRYLAEKYDVAKAFTFVGYVPGNEALYTRLQEAGFIVILKPTLEIKKGRKRIIKGNVDSELFLHTMIQWNNFDRAIIASGDGDFHCLIEHLLHHKKLLNVLIPNAKKYSALLRAFHLYLEFMSDQQEKIMHILKERE